MGPTVTHKQQQSILKYFRVNRQMVPIIRVSMAKEEAFLGGILKTRAMVSQSTVGADVIIEGPGYGIHVKTHNIATPTSEMYESAFATAGIQDARISVAGPCPINGDAAFLMVLQAYQKAIGIPIPKRQQRDAMREVILTQHLAEVMHQRTQAVELILLIKKDVVDHHMTTLAQVQSATLRTAYQLHYRITRAQEENISGLMLSIARLSLSASSLNTQVADTERKVGSHLAIGLWQNLTVWANGLWRHLNLIIHTTYIDFRRLFS